MLVTQQSHHKHHNFSSSLTVPGVAQRFHNDSTSVCPFPPEIMALGAQVQVQRGTKHYVSCLSRALWSAQRPLYSPGLELLLQCLSVLIFALSAPLQTSGFSLYATAVQASCTHYIFSSGPRRVLIIFLRRTLCYLSP